MINDKHDLVATFTNGLGKEHNWTYKDVNADLPTPVIKDACELLTNLDIFEQDGVKLFDSMSRAIIKCWFWAIEIVGSFLFIVSFLFLSFHYNFSFDRKVL